MYELTEKSWEAGKALVYLSACAVRETPPERERVAAMDMAALWRLSGFHHMRAMTAMALETLEDPAGLLGEAVWDRWKRARDLAIRRRMLFDGERSRILAWMEEQEIWYAPLKGVLLQDEYPRFGMREMADNDILRDEGRKEELCRFMEARGYQVRRAGTGAHDTCLKEPVYNFEFHNRLFNPAAQPVLAEYYRDVKERLRKDEGNRWGFHFSDEDFYLYVTAHAYKHWQKSGTGLRTLTDCYVILRHRRELDWDYLRGELEKLGIQGYEEAVRGLSLDLYDDPEAVWREALTEPQKEMLAYMITSGTYGSMKHWVDKHEKSGAETLGKSGTLRYLGRRLFPPVETIRSLYPQAERHPVLIPSCYLRRIASAVRDRRGAVRKELEELRERRRGGDG